MQFSKSVDRAIAYACESGATSAERAATSLAAKTAQLQGLKTFPAVAQKAMALLGDPEFKVADLGRLVADDPALGARVMRVANSSFYSRGRPVASFDQAIVRMGRGAVRDVVAAVAAMGMFDDATGIGRAIRDHCAATASVAQVIAQAAAPAHEDGAYLSGLLHDLGKLLLLSSKEALYDLVDPARLRAPDQAHLVELDALGFEHAVLAGQILWHWGIPEPIPQVIAWHHQPLLAYADGEVAAQVAVLRVADHVERVLGDPEEEAARFVALFAGGPDCVFLGLEAERLTALWPSLAEARAESIALFA